MTTTPPVDECRELARVQYARLDISPHGDLTFLMELGVGEGSGVTFRSYSLDTYDPKRKRRVGTAAGLDFILRMMALFGVGRLGRIRGCMIYLLRGTDAHCGPIIGFQRVEPCGGDRFLFADWCSDWGIE